MQQNSKKYLFVRGTEPWIRDVLAKNRIQKLWFHDAYMIRPGADVDIRQISFRYFLAEEFNIIHDFIFKY